MDYQELIERLRKAVISPFDLGPVADAIESLLAENERLNAELAKYRDAIAAIEQGCEDSNSAMMGTLSTTWIMKMIGPLIVKPDENK